MDRPAVAVAPHGRAVTSLHAVDDARLIADLLGPAAAATVRHLPVSTLLDVPEVELERLGLPPAARRHLLAAAELARRFQPRADLPEPHDRPGHLLPCLADLRAEPVESLGIIPLNNRLRSISGLQRVAGGHLTHLTVAPREVFAPAVSLHAAAIVLAHNHPSGDAEPSLEDRAFTRIMVSAGQLLDVRVLDHLIVTRRAYFSFRESRLL